MEVVPTATSELSTTESPQSWIGLPGMRVLALAAFALVLGRLPAGDEPPPGPPWLRTYAAAKQVALAKGQPVFVYFTKTY